MADQPNRKPNLPHHTAELKKSTKSRKMSSEAILNKSCSDVFNIDVPIPADAYIWIILDGVLFVVIISGNLVTLYVLRTSLQYTPLVSNRFVLSLAISDTLVGCTLPYHTAFYVTPVLSSCKITCLLRFSLILLATCASITNVVAIAVDRYLAILHPFKYESIMTIRVAHTVLGLGWLNAFVVSTIPLYWNSWHERVPCELGHILPHCYTAAIIMPWFLAIWFVMGIIYWKIWREAANQAYRIRQNNIAKLRRSCLQVVLIIMGCFTICWLPFLAVICAQSIGQWSIHPIAYRTVLSLAFSSAAVNPLIYAWKNKEFKRTFGHIVRCRTASHSLQNDRSSIIDRQLQTSTPRNSLLQEMQQAAATAIALPVQSNV